MSLRFHFCGVLPEIWALLITCLICTISLGFARQTELVCQTPSPWLNTYDIIRRVSFHPQKISACFRASSVNGLHCSKGQGAVGIGIQKRPFPSCKALAEVHLFSYGDTQLWSGSSTSRDVLGVRVSSGNKGCRHHRTWWIQVVSDGKKAGRTLSWRGSSGEGPP